MHDDNAAKTRGLNDQARQTFTGCRVAITPGIQALGEDALRAILRAVQQYDDFSPDNDPYEEHDFGAFHYADHQVFWKFDYYDLDLTMHSPGASDPTVTARVLTVMLAEEY
ncbi:DUF3768 domain-containing protein [Marimonas arenosa]|uniref:DUF3768 domain-containing protein n=1 Tax=Marimonas arenosa TaxID=1795305 RepID=A0AAE4B770_9RHOB|nr:DUF3768 domain-containing protein [Marimonas arenosa]MDQ2091161.1 DUF3768 domain-containing protein [Marimonas arenosa]